MGIMETTDDSIKAIEGFGNLSHNASVAMKEIFSKLSHFTRYLQYESNRLQRSWNLYAYPNNRRRFKGKPLVRTRAYVKAYKNERRK